MANFMEKNILCWCCLIERRYEISNNVVCVTSKGSDQPVHMRSLIRAFTSLSNILSTLDKQRICVNTQLKSSKKQLKLKVCVLKSNSNDRYAITCDVNAYHLVHFVSIWVINKCQSGIDFIFTSEHAI